MRKNMSTGSRQRNRRPHFSRRRLQTGSCYFEGSYVNCVSVELRWVFPPIVNLSKKIGLSFFLVDDPRLHASTYLCFSCLSTYFLPIVECISCNMRYNLANKAVRRGTRASNAVGNLFGGLTEGVFQGYNSLYAPVEYTPGLSSGFLPIFDCV